MRYLLSLLLICSLSAEEELFTFEKTPLVSQCRSSQPTSCPPAPIQNYNCCNWSWTIGLSTALVIAIVAGIAASSGNDSYSY